MDFAVNDQGSVERVETRTAELERTNEELEAFAHLVAHDLKTPLQVVSGYLELLHERTENQLDATSAGYLEEATRGAAKMEQLIDDMLSSALAPTIDATKETVDLNALFTEALLDYFPSVESQAANVTIGVLPTVVGSPMMLRRLFVNLISNAIKFHRTDTGAVVEVSSSDGHDDCTIRVTDNGRGVPVDEREVVFAMFRRLDHDLPGSGIGLAICHRIVLAHRGRIWIEDGIDGGASVCFTIPT